MSSQLIAELENIEEEIESIEQELCTLEVKSEEDYDYRQDLLKDLRNAKQAAKEVESLIDNPYGGWE